MKKSWTHDEIVEEVKKHIIGIIYHYVNGAVFLKKDNFNFAVYNISISDFDKMLEIRRKEVIEFIESCISKSFTFNNIGYHFVFTRYGLKLTIDEWIR